MFCLGLTSSPYPRVCEIHQFINLLVAAHYSTRQTLRPSFVHLLSVGIWVLCFWFRAFMKGATVNILLHVFW